MFVVWILTAIGAAVLALLAYALLRETIRALRQSYRLATVYTRPLRRRPPLRIWMRFFLGEFGDDYSAKTIGDVRIPWDLKEPIGRRRRPAFYEFGEF